MLNQENPEGETMHKFSLADMSPRKIARLKAWPVGLLALLGLVQLVRPITDWAYSRSFPFPDRGLGAVFTSLLDGSGLALVALVFLLIISVTDAAAAKLEEEQHGH
jgi:hypothetical protein